VKRSFEKIKTKNLPVLNVKDITEEQLSKIPIKRHLTDRPKILLILPNLNWIDKDMNALWDVLPWNLCMLAAMIEDFCEVEILDAYKKNLTQDQLSVEIKNINPDVVGVSVLMDQYGKAGHMVAEITKLIDGDILTVMGGVYATVNPEFVVKDDNIDYVVIGEAEYIFRDLLNYLRGNSDVEISSGIAYKSNGVIVNKGHSELIKDLSKLPRPAYHLIDFLSYANAYSDRKSVDAPMDYPYARIVTSRGCPFKCTFCQVPTIQGRYFRKRSIEHILDEISWLKNEYGVKALIFDDDNLYTNMKNAKQLFQAMIDNNLKLPWVSIATAVFRLDEEMIDLMYESGCRYIDIAIESGSERVINEIVKKPIEHKQAIRLVKYARKKRIFVSSNFIIGFPGETWDEILETISFAEVLDVDYAKIFIAIPLKNTEMYNQAKEKNLLKDGDSESIWTSGGMLETDEFSSEDLTILRAYEWERINFTNPEKTRKIADRMGVTLSELKHLRKNTLIKARKMISARTTYPALDL
jgi:anaerobic magnesium-protoporphyrin IX monomethyl ester cyclase